MWPHAHWKLCNFRCTNHDPLLLIRTHYLLRLAVSAMFLSSMCVGDYRLSIHEAGQEVLTFSRAISFMLTCKETSLHLIVEQINVLHCNPLERRDTRGNDTIKTAALATIWLLEPTMYGICHLACNLSKISLQFIENSMLCQGIIT